MKNPAAPLLILILLGMTLMAQQIDTVPIPIKNMHLKLKRSPLPSALGILQFKPVQLTPATVNAKINYWKSNTQIGINLNQSAFSDNWKSGGTSSLAVGVNIRYRVEYLKADYSYVNELIFQYGKAKNKNQLQKKTTDRIFWDHKAALKLSKNWYFFGSINFESQFDKGYSYPLDAQGQETKNLLSKFMSPGYLTQSIGFEYRPNKSYSLRIGTGTARQTFVLDKNLYHTNPNNYAVQIGKKFRNELAFQLVNNLEKELFAKIHLKARYNMFIPYDNLGHIDHRLDISLSANLNRFLNTSITGAGLYDRDTDLKLQANQTLAIGLVFVFPR